MTEPIARLNDVSYCYGKTKAVDHLDLDIQPGEVVAVLGPNGAGKTTTVKLLLGLLQPAAGTVRVFGQSPTHRLARCRVGAMMQVAQVPATLKVREHIDLFRSYYPDPRPAAEVLGLAGLEHLADRLAGRLSGGERQRLMFALAICGNPELLFLDEPTVGMDVAARRRFWRSIRAFIAEGRTVVLTTHYLEEADALADRIVVIDHGRVRASGTPREIKSRVAGRRIACTTRLDQNALEALPGVRSVEWEPDRVCLLSDDAEASVLALLQADHTVSGLEVTGAGLEEAFLDLVEDNDQLEDAA